MRLYSADIWQPRKVAGMSKLKAWLRSLLFETPAEVVRPTVVNLDAARRRALRGGDLEKAERLRERTPR